MLVKEKRFALFERSFIVVLFNNCKENKKLEKDSQGIFL